LIAVLCCFCEWFDFGVFAVSGWGWVNALAGNGDVAPPGFTVKLRYADNGSFSIDGELQAK
jgi:hypothetical protein